MSLDAIYQAIDIVWVNSMKSLLRTLPLLTAFLLVASNAWTLPTSCGTTGLLTQPTAQTLDSGNICVGLWGDYSEWGDTPATEYDATTMPFAITLGLGSFFEVYGSFPNLLFNDEETASGRGYSVLAGKIRVLGKRTSPIKFALDGQFRRHVSMDPDLDGLTDFLGRGILSLNTTYFGIHAWGGILDKEENLGASIGPFEDITGYGGGIEIKPTDRLRIMAEAELFEEDLQPTALEVGEWMAGFQYYISPHLTFNAGYGGPLEGDDVGLSPETRILVGLTTCQGIGSYSRVERKSLPEEEIEAETKKEPVKTLKIKALSPLLSSSTPLSDTPADVASAPVVKGLPEEIIEPAAPAIPVVPLPVLLESAPATTAVEIPVDDAETIILYAQQNIARADVFEQAMASAAGSPIGPPAMDNIVRTEVDVSKPAKVYRRFILPEFSFEVDQFTLTEQGSAALSMIAVELSQDNKWYAMRIDGHTDSTGSDRYNNELSNSRAVEYAMHLVAKNGVDPSRVFVKGYGESAPIADNSSQGGRAQNRRVELLVLVPTQ